jgi:hypothetical protein
MKPVKAKNLRPEMWIAVNFGTAIRALKIYEVVIKYIDGVEHFGIMAHDDNDAKLCVAVAAPDAVFFASDEGPEE